MALRARPRGTEVTVRAKATRYNVRVRVAVVVLLTVVGCGFQPGVGIDSGSRRDARAPNDANDAPLPSDLVAWYTMDALVGGAVPDATGHGHDGACARCPLVDVGHISNGYVFAT